MALSGQYGDLEHKTKVKLSVMVGEVWAVWNYMVGFGASLYTVGNFSPLTADGEERERGIDLTIPPLSFEHHPAAHKG